MGSANMDGAARSDSRGCVWMTFMSVRRTIGQSALSFLTNPSGTSFHGCPLNVLRLPTLIPSENLFTPAVRDRDPDDLRHNSSALFPPEFYLDHLDQTSVRTTIGAEVAYSECPKLPFELFARTDNDARTWLPAHRARELEVEDPRMGRRRRHQLGGHASVLAMNWYGKARLAATPFTNMTIKNVAVAAIQNVNSFRLLRGRGSGDDDHTVPLSHRLCTFCARSRNGMRMPGQEAIPCPLLEPY
ncbi:hypothetical protein GGX14DRAFT_406116 [Mycena pura]|uniref:Uncharacterized protein n=1 Tax=Mycena pura TaxID=153505 RepID=A0AAD6UQX6_9AGAR|nr:hypothetical protein GGX14DRAFT_406116 [Mycena pura]